MCFQKVIIIAFLWNFLCNTSPGKHSWVNGAVIMTDENANDDQASPIQILDSNEDIFGSQPHISITTEYSGSSPSDSDIDTPNQCDIGNTPNQCACGDDLYHEWPPSSICRPVYVHVDTEETPEAAPVLQQHHPSDPDLDDISHMQSPIPTVPGYPEWYNIVYTNDEVVYSYQLMKDYEQGDLEIVVV